MPGSPTVLGAIVAVFDGSAAGKGVGGDTAKSGGLWFGTVPEKMSDQNLPFVAFTHEGDVAHYNTEIGYFETCSFKFEVFDVGLAACEAVAQHIKTAFDKPHSPDAMVTFQVTGANVWQCWRSPDKVGYRVDTVGERISTGEQVFRATLNYEINVSKSL